MFNHVKLGSKTFLSLREGLAALYGWPDQKLLRKWFVPSDILWLKLVMRVASRIPDPRGMVDSVPIISGLTLMTWLPMLRGNEVFSTWLYVKLGTLASKVQSKHTEGNSSRCVGPGLSWTLRLRGALKFQMSSSLPRLQIRWRARLNIILMIYTNYTEALRLCP